MKRIYTNDLLMPRDGLLTMTESGVRLLLNMTGSNGSTVFVDHCGHTVTANGDAQISTAQSPFGEGSLLLGGSGDYLNIVSDDSLAISTNLFTLETWIYGIAVNGRHYYIDKRSADYRGWTLFSDQDSNLRFFAHYASGWDLQLNSGISIGTGSWKHVAISRVDAMNFEMHIGGTQVANTTVAPTYSIEQCSTDLRMGWTVGDPNEYSNCYFGPTRLTVGRARYSGATITVPTGPF